LHFYRIIRYYSVKKPKCLCGKDVVAMKFKKIFAIIWLLMSYAWIAQATSDGNGMRIYDAWPCFQGKPSMTMNIPNMNGSQEKRDAQQDSYNFDTPHNRPFDIVSPEQVWQWQRMNRVFNSLVCVMMPNRAIKITPEDILLINRICADNPHKNLDALRLLLAGSSIFNDAQTFLKGDRCLDPFTNDIFINKNHFQNILDNEYRLKKLMHAAYQALDERHKQEQSDMQSRHKAESKACKQASKQEIHEIHARHKKEQATLDAQQKKEYASPLGNTATVHQALVEQAKAQTEKFACNQPPQPTPMMNRAEIARMYDQIQETMKKFSNYTTLFTTTMNAKEAFNNHIG